MPKKNEQRDILDDSKDDLAYCALSDEELSEASGGVVGKDGHQINCCDTIEVSGSLYQTSYAERYSGSINGTFQVQRVIEGRPAPIQIKTSAGWIRACHCYYVRG